MKSKEGNKDELATPREVLLHLLGAQKEIFLAGKAALQIVDRAMGEGGQAAFQIVDGLKTFIDVLIAIIPEDEKEKMVSNEGMIRLKKKLEDKLAAVSTSKKTKRKAYEEILEMLNEEISGPEKSHFSRRQKPVRIEVSEGETYPFRKKISGVK